MINPQKAPTLWASARTLLIFPDYRCLLSSNALWWQAMFMENIVVGWLVLELTNSPWQVSLIGFCRSAPFLIFGFFSGPIMDRFGRRPVIIGAQMANLAAYIFVTVMLWTGRLALWHMAVSALVLGAAWALDWPARRALLPDLIGKAKTVEAMLLENFVQSLSRIIGPSLAGALIDIFGPLGCFLALIMLSATALAIISHLSKQPIPRTALSTSTSPWKLMSEGLHYVGHNQAILGVLLITVVANLLYFPYMNILSVFARDVLGQGPVGLGFLGAASGIGAFIGLYVINLIRHRVSNGWIFVVGTFSMSLLLLLFALSTHYLFSALMLILAGIGQACFGIMQSSIILLAVSDEMRSRAMGTLVLAIGSDPLGKLQTGLLAEQFGAPFSVALQAGVSALAIAIITLTLPGLCKPLSPQHEETPVVKIEEPA